MGLILDIISLSNKFMINSISSLTWPRRLLMKKPLIVIGTINQKTLEIRRSGDLGFPVEGQGGFESFVRSPRGKCFYTHDPTFIRWWYRIFFQVLDCRVSLRENIAFVLDLSDTDAVLYLPHHKSIKMKGSTGPSQIRAGYIEHLRSLPKECFK